MERSQRRSGFDPRSREGSDLGIDACDCRPVEFRSALPRRERRRSGRHCVTMRAWCFDPRSREGSDRSAASIAAAASMFRSALPRRERHPVIADGIAEH